MDEENLNLYQKMALIRKSVDVIKKNKKGLEIGHVHSNVFEK